MNISLKTTDDTSGRLYTNMLKSTYFLNNNFPDSCRAKYMSSRFMGSGKEYKDDQSLNLLDPKVSMIPHALFVIIVTIKQMA